MKKSALPIALALLLVSSAAPASALRMFRIQGSIDGFDSRSVTVRVRSGALVEVAREAFPRWVEFRPGARITIQVPKAMVLRVHHSGH
jgi:hypothetical protein